MSGALRELERSERRVLGALRCVDLATGVAIGSSLQVGAEGAHLLRNRSGLYVILEWPVLAEHAAAFAAPPDEPDPSHKTLVLTVRDPMGRYLQRLVDVSLPRDPKPASAGNADSLFQPIEVPMYPSPTAPVLANWAALRVSVTESVRGDALGGAFIRVIRISDGAIIARGLTDWRGEALVPTVGLKVTDSSDPNDANDSGPVVVSETATRVEVYFDPSRGTRTSISSVNAGRPPHVLPLVNPVAIEDDAGTLPAASKERSLAAGRQDIIRHMEITLP